MMPRLPAGYSSGFFPPREAEADDFFALASGLFIGVSSPKGSWGGVNDAALASRLFLGVSSPTGSWGGVDDAALAIG